MTQEEAKKQFGRAVDKVMKSSKRAGKVHDEANQAAAQYQRVVRRDKHLVRAISLPRRTAI